MERKPSRSAVYEELYHIQQFRSGKIDGTVINAYECEIEAQEYLLKNAEILKLTQVEVLQTQKALQWYQDRIRVKKGDDKI